MKKIRFAFTLIIFTILTVGCKPESVTTEMQPSLTLTESPPLSLTPTTSPTATPTLTPSPTPPPTPILPVQLGTQLPDTSSSLNLQNITDIRELAMYSGNANTIIRVSNDNQFLVTGSTGGIDIYDFPHNSFRFARNLP